MRFLDLTLPSIHENLALEEALLVDVEAGRLDPLLRVWELDHSAVVMGASGKFVEDVQSASCRVEGIPIARRSSGGGTVVLGPGALNFSVILRRDFATGLDAVDFAQLFVLERVATELRAHGFPVFVLGSGDLTVERRKVAGSAQRRLKTHFLVHATILYSFPLDQITRYLCAPERQPEYREGRSHDDFVANLPIERSELVDVLRAAWSAFDPEPIVVPVEAVQALALEKFSRPEWIERL